MNSDLNPVYADLEAARTRIIELESKLDKAEERTRTADRMYDKMQQERDALASRLDSVLRAVRGFLAGEIVRADLAWMTRDDSAVENPLHRCPECNGIMDAHLGSCSRAVERPSKNCGHQHDMGFTCVLPAGHEGVHCGDIAWDRD